MSERRSHTGGLGWVVFILALGVAAILLGSVEYETAEVVTGTFFEKFLALKPSEMGDTLAGVFGSLAFLVAVGTIYLQSRELAAQREELRLTREVMEQQSKAAEDMAASMKAQAKIFEQEQKEREESRADGELEALMAELKSKLDFGDQSSLTWEFDVNRLKTIDLVDCGIRTLTARYPDGLDLYECLQLQLSSLKTDIDTIRNDFSSRSVLAKPQRTTFLTEVITLLDKIEDRSADCSNAMASKLRIAGVAKSSGYRELIENFAGHAQFWADPQ